MHMYKIRRKYHPTRSVVVLYPRLSKRYSSALIVEFCEAVLFAAVTDQPPQAVDPDDNRNGKRPSLISQRARQVANSFDRATERTRHEANKGGRAPVTDPVGPNRITAMN